MKNTEGGSESPPPLGQHRVNISKSECMREWHISLYGRKIMSDERNILAVILNVNVKINGAILLFQHIGLSGMFIALC